MKQELPPALTQAARTAEVHSRCLAVYIELHSHLDTDAYRKVQAWHLAALLHISRSHVHNALATLVRLGYLERGERTANASTFRLITHPAQGVA